MVGVSLSYRKCSVAPPGQDRTSVGRRLGLGRGILADPLAAATETMELDKACLCLILSPQRNLARRILPDFKMAGQMYRTV
jgi:hypothetical protein